MVKTSKTYKYFSAFTAVESAQWVLALAATNPRIGSALLSGKTGTGKSSLVQALGNILSNKKLIKLPLSVTEEALFGSFDMEKTLHQGKWQYENGIFAKVHKNILFIDNINLLSTKIAYKILQIQEQGYFYTPSGKEQACDFSIIATMNPEEGGITTKTLDRFGLFVELPQQATLGSRLEILKEQERWEVSAKEQQKTYQLAEQKWQKRMQNALSLLHKVKIKDTDLQAIAQLCKEAFVAGHRGDLALLWGTVTYTALQGRTSILMEDILAVKDWALAHRIRSPRQAPPQPKEQEKNANTQQNNPPQNTENKQSKENEIPNTNNNNNTQPEHLPSLSLDDTSQLTEDNQEEEWVGIENLELELNILQNQGKIFEKKTGTGKRVKCRYSEGKGRHIRSKNREKQSRDIDFAATVRKAVPFQKIRPKNALAIRIYKDDLQQKVREQRIGNTILFLVDASGSMGIQQRMKEAKAGVFSLLKDAYVHRDTVGLMTFRKEKSELLLPPTRSFTRAYELLQEIKTGGRTPLFHGLQSALELLATLKNKDQNSVPILVIFTDGKATSAYKGENTMKNIQKMAEKYRTLQLKTFLIDTECGFIRLGHAKQIAEWLNASYFHIDDLKDIGLKKILHQ